MRTISQFTRSILSFSIVIAGLIAASQLAVADESTADTEKKDATADRIDWSELPAVRNRVILRAGRFEITPSFEATVNANYKHTVAGGVKLEYSFTDRWSVGAIGFFGKSFNTGLVDKILGTLPDTSPDGDPTPTRTEYAQHLNEIPLHGAVYGTLTPWFGKLAAFGKAFVNFDFYFSAGLAFAQLSNDCDTANVCDDPAPGINDPGAGLFPDGDPNNDPPLNDGGRVGLFLGGGIHVYLNDSFALDLTVRNYLFNDNPSGLDVFADRAVNDEDSKLLNHLFVGIGVSVFLPFNAKRTP